MTLDTIVAVATAPGRAGVAIVRMSGPVAWSLAEVISGALPAPATARLRLLREPESGEPIDRGLVLPFPEGGSFTGEAVVEFHVHGSLAVQKRLLEVLTRQPGVRVAEAGEFTRRALENGRLDLAQVEGLSDLIAAETEGQRRQALRILSGDLGERVKAWREQLVRASALLMAALDFSEEDLPETVLREIGAILQNLVAELERELARSKAAERVRNGVEVAIVGAPNVGKSTLLNHLAGRDVALTSDIAGTTRDVLEVRLDLAGMACTVLDTAGLRDAGDEVEVMGVTRARQRAAAADIRIFLTEGDPDPDLFRDGDLIRRPKADMSQGEGLGVSGLTGLGVHELLRDLSAKVSEITQENGLLATVRQQTAIRTAVSGIVSALKALDKGEAEIDLVAEEVRSATRTMDSLIGKVDVEDLLDDIFSRFCIGK